LFDKLKKALGEFVTDISTRSISEGDLESSLWNLQLALVECDVALPAAESITNSLKERLVGVKVKRFEDIAPVVKSSFESILEESLSSADLLSMAKSKSPFSIMFVGVNGTGKTTTIAKVARYLLDNGVSVVFACGDTYRAGSEEQIETHAQKLGVKVIKHKYGADPAAVAFDAVTYAKNSGVGVVLIDTAGRMQTDKDLMGELMKIKRVVQPDMTIFVGDSLAGNDALHQAEEFNKSVSIDGVILTKVDADSKGGAAISISSAIKKPIFFLGVGQSYKDLIPFDASWVIKNILSKTEKK
jgi:fused signal recognition particle receptor